MRRPELLHRTPLRFTIAVALAIAATASMHVDDASAAGNDTASAPLNWRPPPRHLGPSISGSPAANVTVGQAYAFTPTAADARHRTLRFAITAKPGWAAFNASTGTLSGTPSAANVGTTSGIVIRASDGISSASLPAFSLTVAAAATANRPPAISGTPATTDVAGTAYSFKPTASDPDGNTLSFAVQNKPAWASFSMSTGALTGTPTVAQTGTYSNIVISASDGKATASLTPFGITVSAAATASPPTITGTPLTSITVGAPYSFTPAAKSSSGSTLTFSVQQKPSWATFDTTTGVLAGTPVAANVGLFPGIVIGVSDGRSSAALPGFTITVNAAAGGAAPGTATVSWVAPTQNTDGSPLSNLAGYHVYFGTSATSVNQMQTVAGAGATNAVIGNLLAGTWFFGVKSYTNTGEESAMSSLGTKAIP